MSTKNIPKQPSKSIKDSKSMQKTISTSKTKTEDDSEEEHSSSGSSVSEPEKEHEEGEGEGGERGGEGGGEDGGGDVGEGKKEKKRHVSKKITKIHIDREEFLQAHRDLTFDRNQLQIKNNILHRRLSEYYKKRKMEHVLKPLENSMDLEEKYQQKLLSYEELKEKEERESESIRKKLQEITSLYESQEEKAVGRFTVLQDHERNTGSGLIYAKKGKPISEKTVDRFMSLQKTKTATASAMMLRYIRVRNAVMEQEAIIRKLEKIGPGLYVAQYEQLRVDKLNYTSKIEERDDELIRNRVRCTEHNQMLAHIREKMHHTTEVIDITECDLGDAEIEYQIARGELNAVKTRRDKLRIATERERLKAGLIPKKMLLRDFENAIDLVEKLKDKKAYLEQKIAKYNMELRHARKCIIEQGSASSSDDFFI